MFTVQLQSKDKHIFQIDVNVVTEDEAISIALNQIELKGWSQYGYKFYRIESKD